MNKDLDTCLYVADINTTEYDFKSIYDLMPSLRIEKCDRLKFEDDKKRCVLAWGLLIYSIYDYMGKSVCEDVESYVRYHYAESEKGKPYIEGLPICFNISHSGDKVICAVSKDEVGCDVEVKTGDCLKIAKRFFASKEYEYLSKISDEDILDKEFLRIWTMKEAFVKAKGVGIAYPFGDISFVDHKDKIVEEVTDEDNKLFCFGNFDLQDGYSYCVCNTLSKKNDDLRKVDKIAFRNNRIAFTE